MNASPAITRHSCPGIAVSILCLLSLLTTNAFAEDIRIAVASNFTNTLGDLAKRFEQQTGHRVKISGGSTGKHYAQIINGAPYDLFFAADSRRPERLEEQGLIVSGSRFTYAKGKLVLWYPYGSNAEAYLRSKGFKRMAIANPRLAPYGRAAQQTLERMNLWPALQDKIVRGENIGQTFHFTDSGSVQLGLVALSQLRDKIQSGMGSVWLVPADHYDPIEQQAVLLRDSPATAAFVQFINTQQARSIIASYGYNTVP